MSTRIEWTDETWNPTVGCSIVSPGCTNCYAMKMAHRVGPNFPHYAGLTRMTKGGPVWTGNVSTAPDRAFLKPLRWRDPRRIFVNSMSDLFHEGIADEIVDRVFAVIALAPHHTYQILTKRAERMHVYMTAPDRREKIMAAAVNIQAQGRKRLPDYARSTMITAMAWPLPNVWLGVSAEDQSRANERIPLLLETPAAVRWVSAEPLLGRLVLDGRNMTGDETYWDFLRGERGASVQHVAIQPEETARLSWVVAGGESGPGSRPAHPDWFRSLRNQCAAAGVPFFFKQWGDWGPAELIHDIEGNRFREMEEYVEPTNGMYRLGKRAAGNLLDGAKHEAWPA